jgi:hypothetical protein
LGGTVPKFCFSNIYTTFLVKKARLCLLFCAAKMPVFSKNAKKGGSLRYILLFRRRREQATNGRNVNANHRRDS